MADTDSSKAQLDDERTPLLIDEALDRDVGDISSLRADDDHAWSPWPIVVILLAIVSLATVADTIQETSFKRLLESVICYEYYEVKDPSKILLGRAVVGAGALGGVDESLCKIQAVQSQVASLRGWQIFFDGFPSLLVSIPFGALADKIGRKPILTLIVFSFVARNIWIQSILWFWQMFSLKLVWLSSLHAFFGGSSPVLSAVFMCMVADVTDGRTRSYTFLCIASANMLFAFVGPAIGALLMRTNPWIPLFASSALFAISGVAMALGPPETLGYKHSHIEDDTPKTLDDDVIDIIAGPPDVTATVDLPISRSFPARMTAWRNGISASTAFLRADWRISALLLPFVVFMIAFSTQELFMQYASVRYSTSYSTATLYVSICAGLRAPVMLLILPATLKFMSVRYKWSGPRRDLVLVKICFTLATIGFTLVGFSPNLPSFVGSMIIVTLAYGGMSILRSFMTGLVNKSDVAKLYTVISVVDTIALALGGPIMAGLWAKGLDIGGVALGLPFWFQGALYGSIAMLLLFIGLRKGEDTQDEPQADEHV